MYNTLYGPAVDLILKPFFFASIGFSIPISKMFQGSVIWRGLIYALLMAFGKLCCGLWLLRFTKSVSTPKSNQPTAATSSDQDKSGSQRTKLDNGRRPKSLYPAAILGCAMVARGEIGFLISALAATNGIFNTQRPETAGATDESMTSELYLIVTWAILLCTIIGPLALGFLVKRAKKRQLQKERCGGGGPEDPMGAWGMP